MLIDLIAWATIGVLLNAVGYNWDSWQFWCFLGTYWVVSYLSRERGRIEGMINYLEMDTVDQLKIKRALEQAKESSE